jgi:hypothetical protein
LSALCFLGLQRLLAVESLLGFDTLATTVLFSFGLSLSNLSLTKTPV